MKGSIDRFEGKYAVVVLEDKSITDIEICRLPSEAKEGDIIDIENDNIQLDEKETLRRKNNIKNLGKSLWADKKNPS